MCQKCDDTEFLLRKSEEFPNSYVAFSLPGGTPILVTDKGNFVVNHKKEGEKNAGDKRKH